MIRRNRTEFEEHEYVGAESVRKLKFRRPKDHSMTFLSALYSVGVEYSLIQAALESYEHQLWNRRACMSW
jgi:hypothetical protein